jgi:GT2 family glycosyltransferase
MPKIEENKNMEIKNNRLIVVLGMHRSGTSAITRALQVLGVSLGDSFLPPKGDNLKGFWEDADINALNIEMLSAIDSDWHHLTPIEPINVEALRKKGYFLRAVEMLRQKVDDSPTFAFKDPRVAKLLPFWKEVFSHCQYNVSYVIAVRHPLSVVKSLAKRNGFDAEKTYLLWLGHVITSLTDSADEERVLVDFDRLMQSPDRELTRIAKCTGLKIIPEELKNYTTEFLDKGLRNTVYELKDLLLEDTCPPIVREIYTDLLDVASDKTKLDDIALQKKIVRWSDEFERLKSPLLLVDRLFTQKTVANQAVVERDGQIVSLGQVVAERESQIAGLNQIMGSLNQAVAERDGQIVSLGQVVAERESQIAGLNQIMGSLNQAVAERDGQFASLNQTLTERVELITLLNQVISEHDSAVVQTIAELDGQIANLRQLVSGQEGQITSLNQTVADYEGRIVAYHNEVMGRDVTINTLNLAIAEKDRIIHETYRSHSWRLTKPIRFFSRTVRRTINLGLKLRPSKIRFVYKLAKPHLLTVLRNPNRLKSKLHFLNMAWQSGGYKGVIQRLQQNGTINFGTISSEINLPHQEKSVEELMQQLAYVPNASEPAELRSNKKVAVIIPVYGTATDTRRCIESVIHSTNLTSHEVIIINDCSPESEVDTLMNTYVGKYSHVQILKNKKNLGFEKSVNRGMKQAGEADVILLNSNTEVANNWLDRLIHQAYADDKIGTVTPFSNNTIICNYPDPDGRTLLPTGETVGFLDNACSSANAGMSIDIPTAVGFCMYIKRICLNDVGLFDEKALDKKGGGEEADFCLRTTSKGWRHILATDIFISHGSENSFSGHKETYIPKATVFPYSLAVTAARYRLDNRPVVLFITHTYGGGTEKHVQELAEAISANNARVLFLRPSNGGNGSDITLEAFNKNEKLSVGLSSQNIKLLADVLNAFGVNKVHVHHTIGFGFSVEELVMSIGLPYDITIHDFYPICPLINLRTPNKGYCGSPTTDDCNACLAMVPERAGGIEIFWWRAKFASLLNGANNVYCPSFDTASRIVEHYPAAPVKVVQHEEINFPPMRHATAARKLRRIAILGVLASHKGLGLIEEALALIEKDELPIEFALIGYPERALPASKALSQTGPYNDGELLALIEKIDPDAILFPAQWPETYSYTLTAAILSGRPIVVADIGSLPERVKDIANAFVYPFPFTGFELVNYLLSLNLGLNEVEGKSERVVTHG